MSKTETLATKKVRNASVDFWRLFCTVAIALMHFSISSGAGRGEYGWIHEIFDYANGEYPPFAYGGLLIGIFFLTSGYFMVASYQSKKKRGLLEGQSPAAQAWQYTGTRFKLFWPPILIGSIYGLLIIGIGNKFNIKQWFYSIVLNAYEFAGLSQLGATNTFHDGIFTNQVTPTSDPIYWDQNWLLNFPTWYMSGLLIVGILLYYLMAANEDRFKGLWLPLINIIFFGTWGMNTPLTVDRGQIFFGLHANLFWCMGGLAGGALLYYFVDWLKKKEFGPKSQIFLTILHLVCGLYIILTSIFSTLAFMVPDHAAPLANEMFNLPALFCILVCCMLNKDYVTKLINRKIFGRLGEFSMYWFVAHHPTIFVIAYMSRGVLEGVRGNYWMMLLAYLVLTTIVAIILQFLCKKMKPMLDRFIPEGSRSKPTAKVS